MIETKSGGLLYYGVRQRETILRMLRECGDNGLYASDPHGQGINTCSTIGVISQLRKLGYQIDTGKACMHDKYSTYYLRGVIEGSKAEEETKSYQHFIEVFGCVAVDADTCARIKKKNIALAREEVNV